MRRRLIAIITVIMTFGMILGLTACGGTKQEQDEGRVFGYTAMDLTNPFHIAMKESIESELAKNGDRLVSVDGKSDQTIQNNGIEDMIAQGITALFLNPYDSEGIQPALEACANAGIPVINLDSGVADMSLVNTYISSNNYQAGYICGEEMVRLYPDGGKICLIEIPYVDSVSARVAGVEDAIKGSKVEIVDRKTMSRTDEVLGITEDMLQLHPDVDILWGLNDEVALIMYGVVESSGLQEQVKVFAVDGSPSGKSSVAQGGLYATAAQSPTEIGVKAVECAYDVLNGNEIEKEISIETTLITADNVKGVDTESWN